MKELLLALGIAVVAPAEEPKQSEPVLAAFCPKSGEQTSGMNKICYYNCLGSTVAITIKSTQLCPLSING